MAMWHFTAPEYPKCSHLKREKPNFPITEEVFHKMTLDSDVLPIYEQKMQDYQRFKYGSLRTNEMLQCRWREYLMQLNNLGRSPFMFPHLEDYHFSNYLVRYNPPETISNKKDIRKHYFNGPRFDHIGQIPIADDMHLRKTAFHATEVAKKKPEKDKLRELKKEERKLRKEKEEAENKLKEIKRLAAKRNK